MDGQTHVLVANLALTCLNVEERHILYPRWGGIESGATLSDEFRIMWEPDVSGSSMKQLVHRCFVDSENPKDHGCVTRAWDHSEGSVSFIKDYLKDEAGFGYTEDEFLENLGMFLGVASHHISDLCTPVHVGHKMDFKRAGSSSQASFHRRVERDIGRYANRASIKLSKPRQIKLSVDYFWSIARDTYKNSFLRLEELYENREKEAIIEMTSQVISASVKHTANVWHTVLNSTGMLKRKWSMQPLI
jgi:hypothetical protein